MKTNNFNLDKMGICGATLCGAHCLLSGALIAFIPTLGAVLHNEWVHIGFLLFTIPVTLMAIFSARAAHQKSHPLMIALSGVGLLILGYLIEEKLLKLAFLNAEVVTVIGSLTIVAAHFFNILLVVKKSEQANC
jgi:hypothetical protein